MTVHSVPPRRHLVARRSPRRMLRHMPAVPSGPMIGHPPLPDAIAAMLASRVLLGVHYPSDVVSGAALGAGVAAAVRRRSTGTALGKA